MVSFYIRDRKKESTGIMCSILIKGVDRIILPVKNIRISPKDWENGMMKIGRGRQENGRVQYKLEKLKLDIESFVDEYIHLNKKPPRRQQLIKFLESDKSIGEYFNNGGKVKIVDWIETVIQRRKCGKELTSKNTRYSEGSFHAYESTLNAIKEFQKYSNRAFFYVKEFEDRKLIEEFEIFMISQLNFSSNTIANKMKRLKSFLNLAYAEDVINFSPFKKFGIKIHEEESDNIVFTEQEMLGLENLDLSDNPLHELIRDQYLIYLWSGIRKSDLPHLLAVVNPNSESFTFRSSKTGETCTIPAFDALKRVAAKYNYKFPTPILDTIVLKEIKKICTMIPSMNEIVEKNITKGGIRKKQLKKKCEMVHIHTARRTLATRLFEKNLDSMQIMKITGHKKLSTLQKYVKSDINISRMLEVGNSIGKS
jgi:site-specific recombinase XerD